MFLAGGLTHADVADAIGRARPFGSDLCSGVRTDGRLDRVKLEAFVLAAERADLTITRDLIRRVVELPG